MIKSGNYRSLGRTSASPIKPSGGWTYVKLDGYAIHLTQDEIAPSGRGNNKFDILHLMKTQRFYPLSCGYTGYAPYLFPFEEESDPQGNLYDKFFENRPIETDYQ